MDRVDILATDPGARYRALTGFVLDAEPDPELQELVAEAAAALAAPIAAVTIVLEHTQLFRAHTGLSHELAIAAAIDRDVGFCQWVVHEGQIIAVDDLSANLRMPQRSVEVAGLRAYLGAPVSISGTVIGALCIMDTQPRTFALSDREAIELLAVRVSERLQALAGAAQKSFRRGPDVPALAELRNGIIPLRSDVARARVLCAEAASLARLARAGVDPRAHELLTRAGDATAELAAVLADVEGTAGNLDHDVGLLEVALCEDDNGALLDEVVAFADGLARRLTGARGGVRWSRQPQSVSVRASRTVAAGILATTLGEVAMRQDNDLGTDAYIRVDATAVSIHLDADLGREGARDCAHAVSELLGPHPSARVEAAGPLVVVRLLRAYDC